METKIKITLITLLMAFSVNAQNWENTTNCEYCGSYPVMDTLGNLYSTNLFKGTVSFCNTNIASIGNNTDGWIAKYDTAGNCVWVKTFGASNISNNLDYGAGVTIDKENNLLLVGQVCDSLVYYDNSLLTDVRSGQNLFFAKVNSADGSLIWQRSLQIINGSPNAFNRGAITSDDENNIYVSFSLKGKLIINSTTNVITSKQLPVIIKYDKDGNYKWHKLLFVYQGGSTLNKLISKNSNIYCGGYFSGTLTVDGQSISTSSVSTNNGFVLKIDTSGNVIKLKNIIYSSSYGSVDVLSVSNQNEIYFAGLLANAISVDTFNFNNTGINKDFVAGKLDSNLNVLNAKVLPLGSNYILANDLIIKDNTAFLSAFYSYGANIEGTALQGNGTVIYKLNDSLGIEWIKNAYIPNPASNTEYLFGYLNFNKQKNKLIIAGTHQQDATFDNTVLVGSSDFYAVLSDLDNTASATRLSSSTGNKIAIYPNPTQNGVFYITPPNKGVQMPAQVRMFNASGVQVAETPLKQTAKDYAIDISTLPKGEYVLKLSIGKTVYSGRVVYE